MTLGPSDAAAEWASDNTDEAVRHEELAALAHELLGAYRTGTPIEPLRDRVANFTLEDAYYVQTEQLKHFLASGETLAGHKVGLTSLAMQQQLGVDSPDFGFFLAIIGFVAHRVPAGIAAFVDVAIFGHRLPDCLAGAVMAFFGGANEIIIGGIERRRHTLELSRIAVCQFLRRHAFLARRLVHLGTVLVGSGQEIDLFAVKPLEAGQCIGSDQLIGMADMRLAIRIGNRGGDIIAFGGH